MCSQFVHIGFREEDYLVEKLRAITPKTQNGRKVVTIPHLTIPFKNNIFMKSKLVIAHLFKQHYQEKTSRTC